MTLTQPERQAQLQRIKVEIESRNLERGVKIRLENHDQSLGWYTAGSLALPLHQLPLLEQAIEEMRRQEASAEACSEKIILFPSLSERST
jgi:hypothetical protein